MFKNIPFSFLRGDKINAEVMLKLDVGADNTADINFKGEVTEAFRAFVSKGYFSSLNGNVEFCEEEQKCKRLVVCGTDNCNSFEPTEWKASLLARPCPAGKWKNGLGGMYFNRSSRRKRGMASNPLFIIPDFFFAFFKQTLLWLP